MSEFIFVTPTEGLTILHPDKPHMVIPAEGKRVRKDPYWVRMEKQGAVKVSKAEAVVEKDQKEDVKGAEDGQL